MNGLTENDLLDIELRARKVKDEWAKETILALIGEVRNLAVEIAILEDTPPNPETDDD